jgi:hypothetical protein
MILHQFNFINLARAITQLGQRLHGGMVVSRSKLVKLHQFNFTNHKPHMKLSGVKLEAPGIEDRV